MITGERRLSSASVIRCETVEGRKLNRVTYWSLVAHPVDAADAALPSIPFAHGESPRGTDEPPLHLQRAADVINAMPVCNLGQAVRISSSSKVHNKLTGWVPPRV